MKATEALLALADDHLILGQRTAEWTGRSPSLEEELAMANLGLDLVGQARGLYAHCAELEGRGRSEDDLAFLRLEHEYLNLLLVEQPNEDFAHAQVKNFMFAAFMAPYWSAAKVSVDPVVAGIAGQAEKESIHHRRYAAEWVVRLGDGTDESHARALDALDMLWPFCGELFEMCPSDEDASKQGILPDRAQLREPWMATVTAVLERATLAVPELPMHQTGGRGGRHTEHMGHLLAQLQYMQRTHPGAQW
ncbi:MAG: 1,2-phenylacetyl-CoA epoxidase subunit PaaC [Myxococcota bacterium]